MIYELSVPCKLQPGRKRRGPWLACVVSETRQHAQGPTPALHREKKAAALPEHSCTAELTKLAPGTRISCRFQHIPPPKTWFVLFCFALFSLFFFCGVYASETNEICFCLLESMLYFPSIEHLVFVKGMMNPSNRKWASLSVPDQELTWATTFLL